jgi:hypothetical protein
LHQKNFFHTYYFCRCLRHQPQMLQSKHTVKER